MHVHVFSVASLAASARSHRLAGRIAFGLCLLAVTACGPGASVEIAPGGIARLADAERLEVAEAVRATAGGGELDLKAELATELSGRLGTIPVAVGGEPGVESPIVEPGSNEARELTLIYRRADYLADYPRRQSNDRWYWWGLLLDSDGGRIASLHGEMDKGSGDPEARFAKELKRALRAARRSSD